MRKFLALAMLVALAVSTAPVRANHGGSVPRIAQFSVLPSLTSSASASGKFVAMATCVPRTISQEADAADSVNGPQTQVIYFVPQGKPDQCLDQDHIIRAMNGINDFFVKQGLGKLRLDRSGLAIDIPFIRGQKSESGYAGVDDYRNELAARGYNDSNKRYIIFAADNEGGVCGEAEWPGRFAAFFLDSSAGCGVRDFGNGTAAGSRGAEVVVAHEILHNDGAVSLFAPNGCQVGVLRFAHVCTPGGVLAEFGTLDPEYRDVMFPFAIPGVFLSNKVLDRNHDDYFKVTTPFLGPMLVDLEDSIYFE